MQTVLITGGTGLVGKALTKQLLDKGYQVIILTRNIPVNGNPAVQYAIWDVPNKTIDASAIAAADFIVHLAGAGVVDKKWTAAYKKEILDSRTQSSTLLISAMQQQSNTIKAVVSSSAIGWYGADNQQSPFTETDLPASGFLGETCKLWEQSIEPVGALGKRLVKLRTGIVLSNDGGALAEFKKPIQFGIAGILGSGMQMISWIHIDDLCRMFIEAIENDQLNGSYNAVAPNPVNNETLTLTLAKLMKGRFFIPIPVPTFVLKIMLGDRSIEVLKSTTVSAKKIEQAGFTFKYPFIDGALKQLCGK
jgi:uncharacterized protein (TIGR01777 family)